MVGRFHRILDVHPVSRPLPCLASAPPPAGSCPRLPCCAYDWSVLMARCPPLGPRCSSLPVRAHLVPGLCPPPPPSPCLTPPCPPWIQASSRDPFHSPSAPSHVKTPLRMEAREPSSPARPVGVARIFPESVELPRVTWRPWFWTGAPEGTPAVCGSQVRISCPCGLSMLAHWLALRELRS